MAGGPGAYVFGEEEIREIQEVTDAKYLFRYGSLDNPSFKRKVFTFEEEFKKKMGADYCVATSSGTGSLMCCLSAIGIQPGDEVIVPGYTFIASISSIILMNAIPVLAEINDSLTIDPEDVRKKITDKTKAIMVVHMLGNQCNMDEIMKIAKEHNLYVIEDCCQACGASYKGKRLGTIGNIGAFSLNFFKTISTGDGGAVISNDYDMYERAFGFHDQGHKPNRTGVEVGKRSIVGMNMRMNELTGAVAIAQTRKLDEILTTLRTKKAKLKAMISGLNGFKFRTINDEANECATLLTLIFDTKELADAFCAEVNSKTICHSGWHVYNNMEQILNFDGGKRYHKNMLPQTDDILERAVNISVGVVDGGLGSAFGININSTDEEIEAVGNKIIEVVNKLTK
ncbi:MAG: DegT/DnrJ/EryC1/StrS family aminotransferase [Ruminococcaceae bacterium]|nr:DegT/DnrJ/EryC1/StrS family aminotransferase [Oscillospiraceae bacterium]